MKRRAFIQSALITAAWTAYRTGVPPASPIAHSGKWIIPTNKPDRFGLKVMAFNPIPAPDPATWTLQIGGPDEEPMTLKAGDLDRLPKIAPEQPAEVRAVLVGPGELGRVPRPGAAQAGAAEGRGHWVRSSAPTSTTTS